MQGRPEAIDFVNSNLGFPSLVVWSFNESAGALFTDNGSHPGSTRGKDKADILLYDFIAARSNGKSLIKPRSNL